MRLALAVSFVALTGCKATLYSLTGDIITGYVADSVMPYVMGASDSDLACNTGVGLGGFALSFERVTDHTDRSGLVVWVSAALCAEAQARDAEIAHLVLLKAGRTAEAEDARIREKRLRTLAAGRYYEAWKKLVAAFGEPGATCPNLDSGADQAMYLLGLLGGVQAVLNDRGSGGMLGVPLDIPRLATQGARCLKDDAWWSMPSAMNAAVWTSVPGTAPAGIDPWAKLEGAALAGEKVGMRLPRAIQLEMLSGQGMNDEVNRALKASVESMKTMPSNPEFRVLDINAQMMVRHVSDRIWVSKKGFRTPEGALGTLPGESAQVDDTGLLDDLSK